VFCFCCLFVDVKTSNKLKTVIPQRRRVFCKSSEWKHSAPAQLVSASRKAIAAQSGEFPCAWWWRKISWIFQMDTSYKSLSAVLFDAGNKQCGYWSFLTFHVRNCPSLPFLQFLRKQRYHEEALVCRNLTCMKGIAWYLWLEHTWANHYTRKREAFRCAFTLCFLVGQGE